MATLDITAGELAQKLGLKLLGDASVRISGVASLEDAGPGQLSFVRDAKNLKRMETTGASALIVPEGVASPGNGKAYLLSAAPYVAFAKVLSEYFEVRSAPKGVHPQAVVGPRVSIGEGATIEPFVFLKENVAIGKHCLIMSGVRIGANVRIGDDVVIHGNVVIEDNCIIGNRVRLNPGVVIGSDGFGFIQTEAGNVKLPQIGWVELGDDVEVGANTTIDRGTLGATVVGAGTKIDNLVHVAHNARIGNHNVLCAQTGVAGSVTTGERVIFASRAGVGDHIKIGDGATIGPMAGVVREVPAGAVMSGFPAMPHQEWLKVVSMLAQLPALREQFRGLRPKE